MIIRILQLLGTNMMQIELLNMILSLCQDSIYSKIINTIILFRLYSNLDTLL